MKYRVVVAIVTTAAVTALSALVTADQGGTGSTQAQPTLRTPWGEPDLQGIWRGETLTPLQRPARWANEPVLSPELAAAVAKWVITGVVQEDRSKRGTERDVAGAYNQHWLERGTSLADGRTGLIIDPPNGRIPEMTPEGRRRTDAMREYLAALLDGTASGRPGRGISPRRNEAPPMYNVARMNRGDGPEDRSTAGRCFGVTMPHYDGFYRIVQSPGQVGIYHDGFQGQGFIRVIPTDGSSHPPSQVRFLHGDSRGRWEGDTLVVSVSNFTFKSDFQGSRENLRLTERFTRVSPDRLSVRITVEDPTTWTRPWTFEVPWDRQPERRNQVYESNCHEGNFGMIGILANTRAAEAQFAKGQGPDPATQDNATGGGGLGEGRNVGTYPR